MQKKPSKQFKKKQKVRTAAEYEQQIGELTLHLQKLQAEFENYKKRQQAEKAELMDAAKLSILADLLPALDNFDRASNHLPVDLEDNAWAKGMQYIGEQLVNILDEMGVKKFKPQIGETFDASRHDALESIVSDKPVETILEVINSGYLVNDRVARPAVVKVSRGQQDMNEEENT